ncbi:ATP-binding protein [Streptomyces anulatus]|uniref:ATP-binding protein n=1 Tax=Streptomyces anulatus TaxID=1892 RepID=UPI0030E185DF|nr:ATP-binding protein [Streptomyces anulatus]
MRMPIRHVAGNILWTVQGQVWAVFRVRGSGSAHASRQTKVQRLRQTETLIRQLKGESMLMSLCPAVDPASVVERMTAGVDMAASPRYRQSVAVLQAQLEELELTGRTDWLAVPLAMGRGEAFREAAAAARAEVSLQLGLLPRPVSAREEAARLEQAAHMASLWPAGIAMDPATTAEVLWIYGHSARRGLVEPVLPDRRSAERRMRGRGRGAAALGEVVLWEGGDLGTGGSQDSRRTKEAGRRQQSPFAKRWLEVSTEWGSSYQTMLTLAEMPESFAFPGSEHLAVLDGFSFPVDWVVRLQVTAGAEAEAKTRRQANELQNQRNEYDEEPSGPPAQVEKAAGGLAAFREQLTASKSEVEVRAMTTLCVWGATPQEAERRAGELTGHFSGSDYDFVRPLGAQEALWYGMLPGTRTPAVLAKYSEYLVARGFAMAGPFTGHGLGDKTGPLYGMQLSSGGVRPVFTDFTRAPRENASATAAYVGELGSGKSLAMKAAMFLVLAAGRQLPGGVKRGRVVVVDRTPRQEWVEFARACPGETECITIDDTAAISLDPLRIFTGSRAQRVTESFLTLLLNLSPLSDEGIALSEAIEAVLKERHPSMRVLLEELTNRGAAGGDAPSAMVARRLAAPRRKDLARAIFDETLPVVRNSRADSVVFSVASLQLPTQEELAGDRLEKLEFEKTFGRAVMYLVAALCREIVYADLSEFALAVFDECWWLTSSPEGMELVLELVRDGRKHNAGALFGSPDSDDIGPNNEAGRILRGLIRRKYLFRHSDEDLARRGLAFLGCNPDDPGLLELVTTQLSPSSPDMSDEEREALAGGCLHRDLAGRIGTMQITVPADAAVAQHIYSQPIQSTSAA